MSTEQRLKCLAWHCCSRFHPTPSLRRYALSVISTTTPLSIDSFQLSLKQVQVFPIKKKSLDPIFSSSFQIFPPFTVTHIKRLSTHHCPHFLTSHLLHSPMQSDFHPLHFSETVSHQGLQWPLTAKFNGHASVNPFSKYLLHDNYVSNTVLGKEQQTRERLNTEQILNINIIILIIIGASDLKEISSS